MGVAGSLACPWVRSGTVDLRDSGHDSGHALRIEPVSQNRKVTVFRCSGGADNGVWGALIRFRLQVRTSLAIDVTPRSRRGERQRSAVRLPQR